MNWYTLINSIMEKEYYRNCSDRVDKVINELVKNEISILRVIIPTLSSYTLTTDYKKAIETEIKNEYGNVIIFDEQYDKWKQQGVMFLNIKISDNNYYNEAFGFDIFNFLKNRMCLIYFVWNAELSKKIKQWLGLTDGNSGNKKTDKEKRIIPTNIVLTSGEPIIRNRFIGNKHFMLANHYLQQWHLNKINCV